MVTSGTYRKEHFFSGDRRLSLLQDALLSSAQEYDWRLHGWAVFSNHYHFISESPDDPSTLSAFLSSLHVRTSEAVNRLDGKSGRKVWYQYWDSHITYEKSYIARLNYVNNNPVKHGLVSEACDYQWCSASWFEMNASRAFVRMVNSFHSDRLQVFDDF